MSAAALGGWEGGTAWSVGIGLKGVAVLLVVLVLARVVSRRSSAGLRHLLWTGGIAAVLLLPPVSLALPWRLPVAALRQWSAPLRAAPPAGPALAAGTAAAPAEGVDARMSSPPTSDGASRPGARWVPWLLAVWALGAAYLLAVLGLGAMSLRRLVRAATPLDSADWTRPLIETADRLGLTRLPRMTRSDRVAMPIVCSLLAPTIVMPDSATGWSDSRRRAVLAHELAHLRRRDLAANLACRLACALHWFNPLVWIAARRVRVEGERASDDLALHAGARPSEYADHLLQVVCGAQHAVAPAVAIPMAQPREFEGRMLAILDAGARRDQPSRRQALAVAALAAVLLVPLAAVAPAAPADAVPATPAGAERGRGVVLDRAGPEGGPARRADARDGGAMLAALLAALEAPDAGDRARAARALGAIGARSAVPALGARLTGDRDSEVRGVSAWAIAQTGSPAGTRYLSVAALSDPSLDVRGMALWGLGRIADPAAVPTLVAELGDTIGEFRALAAWALGGVRPPTAPPALIAALADPDPWVTEWAAWAAGRIRDPAAVPGLATLVREGDPTGKPAFESLWALVQIGGDTVRQPLTEALRSGVFETGVFDPILRDAITAVLAGRSFEARERPWPRRSPF